MVVNDLINYERIAKAQLYYRAIGYLNIDVPWLVSTGAVYSTLPKTANAFVSNAGALVGSAEQSFIQMMIDGTLEPGKYQATTPCYRDEKVYNELNRKSFMKVELIELFKPGEDIEVIRMAYQRVVNEALQGLFRISDIDQFDVVQTPEGYDINYNGIELGSYGVRQMDENHIWVYGTGLAEPRFSIVTMRPPTIKAPVGNTALNFEEEIAYVEELEKKATGTPNNVIQMPTNGSVVSDKIVTDV